MKIKRAIISLLMLTSFLTLSSCGLISNFFGPDEDEEETTSGNPLIKTSTTTTSTDGDTTTTSVNTNTSTSTTTSIVQTYTLSFDKNGADGINFEIGDKNLGEIIQLPECSFIKSGFTFYGWFDGENTYSEGADYEVIGNVTFKALWDNDDTYHITYVTGNGKNSALNPIMYETLDDVELIDAEVPEGFDYEFDGWYTSLDFEDKVTSLYGLSGDLTLYAAYKKPLYWYDIEGTGNSDEMTVNVDYSEGVISRLLNYGLFYNTKKLIINLSNIGSASAKIATELHNIEQEVMKNYYHTGFTTSTHGSNMTITVTYNFGANGQENAIIADISSVQGKVFNFAQKDGDHGFYNYLLSSTKINNIETSEQLYYALENGYNFTITPGSLAEEVYDKAYEILNDIIDEDMSEKEKILAISAYIMENVNYNHELSQTAGDDTNANTYQYFGHFASGALLQGSAVCDGYAKAFTILCGLEGIKSKVSRGYLGNINGGHAWNKVFIDADNNGTKEWYTIDLTNAEIGVTIDSTTYEASNYSRILITDYDLINLGYAYRGTDLINSDMSGLTDSEKYAKGQDLNNIKDLSETYLDLYADTKIRYGLAEYDFVVSNQVQLHELVNKIKPQILESNIFLLSVEAPEDLSINKTLVGLNSYNIYKIDQDVFIEGESGHKIVVYIFVKH